MGRQAAIFAACFCMASLDVEEIFQFYRGKKSFRMRKNSCCGKMVTVWRPHYQKQQEFFMQIKKEAEVQHSL